MEEYVFHALPEPTAAPTEPTLLMWPWYLKLLYIGIGVLILAAVAVGVFFLVRAVRKRKKAK